MNDILELVHTAASREILYLPHALRQMARPQRRIRRVEIEAVVWKGTAIEDYPDDVRGHSCLMSGVGQNARPVHVVCAPKAEYLAIITAYLPAPERWDAEFRRRR
ncbi:MAG: DUF4258 domain-containing protein [Chloroflexi bacterium]|nr:DUF4258 domain-containing protein [Chloroflexota bacterium]